jgi:hypothetical protein
VKCISVNQPWASAIMLSWKKFENRTWPTGYRGDLLVHAGSSRKSLGKEGDRLPRLPRKPDGTPDYDALPFGAILGVVRVVDCRRVEDLPPDPHAVGPWCFVLADPRPWPAPVPYRGTLGLFEVPDAVLAGAAGRPAQKELF